MIEVRFSLEQQKYCYNSPFSLVVTVILTENSTLKHFARGSVAQPLPAYHNMEQLLCQLFSFLAQSQELAHGECMPVNCTLHKQWGE